MELSLCQPASSALLPRAQPGRREYRDSDFVLCEGSRTPLAWLLGRGVALGVGEAPRQEIA